MVLDTQVRLTDDATGLFDRIMGRLFRRAEAREASAFERDRRAINDKVRLLARLGDTVIAAREEGSDPLDAIGAKIGWERLGEAVEEAKRLMRPAELDPLALAVRSHAMVHGVGPVFLDAFAFRSTAAAGAVLKAIEVLRRFYAGGRWSLPKRAA